jgi:retron-type reverse transcriptase
MPEDAPVNVGALDQPAPLGAWSRVSGMQTKLHHWAAADPDRRFDDLFNFVHDPATLLVAFDRVAGNTGANTPGVDGLTVAAMENTVAVNRVVWNTNTQAYDERATRARAMQDALVQKVAAHMPVHKVAWDNAVMFVGRYRPDRQAAPGAGLLQRLCA